LKFGASLLRKLGPKRSHDIAQRMRQLARLSLQLAKTSSRRHSSAVLLDRYISSGKFDRVLSALCLECGHFEDDNGRTLFGNPNLALKLGHSLLKLAKLKLGDAIRSKDFRRKEDAQDLEHFTHLISLMKCRRRPMLPIKSDQGVSMTFQMLWIY
jgi:hypothetical protein